jgi:hypothetical protein
MAIIKFNISKSSSPAAGAERQPAIPTNVQLPAVTSCMWCCLEE